MKLVPNWKDIVTKAWSMRWWAVAVVLGGLESFCAYADENILSMPPGFFSMLGTVCGIAGMYARNIDQGLSIPAKSD